MAKWRVGPGGRVGVTTVAAAVVAAAWSLSPKVAVAAGVEDAVAGTVALGRAANYVRVNDFMATWQNPANLALAPRNVGAELRMPFFSACFDRARDNRSDDLDMNGQPGIQYRAEETFDEVCNDAPLLPSGNLGFSMPLGDRFGLGAGFFTPAGVGSVSFGSANNVTFMPKPNEQLPLTTTGNLAPNQYLLIDRLVLAGFLGVGLGYAPTEQLRLGLTLATGFVDVAYRNFASQSPLAQEQDVVNDVRARDPFIPRATASMGFTPTKTMDIFGSLTWTDDVHARGFVDVSANGIRKAPRKSCRERTLDPSTGLTDATPGPHCRVNNVTLDVPYQRFEAVLGVRYAKPRLRRGGQQDPMTEEAWDIELDGYWVNTAHVKAFTLTLYEPDAPVEEKPFIAFSTSPNFTNAIALPARASLPHAWRDTFGARLGGDYHALPGVLSVRAGVAYETRGVPIKNMNIDYWPVQKVTASLGATLRVGTVDLSVAYAHTFQETVDVPVGGGALREVVVMAPQSALVVNEGRYTSSIDTVSLQGNYRF